MDNAVAIAAITLAGTTVGALIWVVKYIAKELSEDLRAHTVASVQAAQASVELKKTVAKVGKQAELSAKNSQEQLVFMKKLNGKLENAIVQKVSNQTVEHQHIESQDAK